MKAVLLITPNKVDRSRYEWSLLINNRNGKLGAIISGTKTHSNRAAAERNARGWAERLGLTFSGGPES